MIQAINISLVGNCKRAITNDFLTTLKDLDKVEVHFNTSQKFQIIISRASLKRLAQDSLPHDFESSINNMFIEASTWIVMQCLEEHKEIANLELVLNSWITQHQFEVKIPSDFLTILNKQELDLSIHASN